MGVMNFIVVSLIKSWARPACNSVRGERGACGTSSPSPRLRGEGRDEGLSPPARTGELELVERPPPPHPPPPNRRVGERGAAPQPPLGFLSQAGHTPHPRRCCHGSPTRMSGGRLFHQAT